MTRPTPHDFQLPGQSKLP